MATTTVTPSANSASNVKEIRTRVKSVFDLDSKDYASLFKVGSFSPVSTMEDFVSRLGNDSALILQVVNEGLEEYAKRQLENSDIPYSTETEDGKIEAFSGTPISEEKSAQLSATVLNIAKMMFGFPDLPRGTKMTAEEQKANREKKSAAKQAAIDFVLSNPAAVEALRK
jgi:hypothetical protein